MSWAYDSLYLPSAIHASKAKVAELLSYLSSWCKLPIPILKDPAQLEAHLLLFGLMYRGMDLALYEFDPDGGGYKHPAYLVALTVSEALFLAASKSFAFLANALPAAPLLASVPPPIDLPTPADSAPSSVTGGIRAAIVQKSKPKPKQPPRRTQNANMVPLEKLETNPALVTNDSLKPPPADESRELTPISNTNGDEQAVRCGSRDRYAPKQFNESESDEPLKKKKGARSGAKGGRGRAK